MYVGHFAIGMAIKARRPEIPTLPILLGVGVLDIVDGLLIIAGVNRMTPDPRAGPYLYFDLDFIDWDHSLLMALVLSLLWGAFFLKDRRVAGLAALAAFSHFVADWPMHNGDLALYPHAATHLGYGLWGKLGTGAWLLEGVFSLALCLYAWRCWARRGVSMLWPCAVLIVLFLQLSPWLSPLKFIGLLDERTARIAGGALVALGFVVPGLLLVWLIDRAARGAH